MPNHHHRHSHNIHRQHYPHLNSMTYPRYDSSVISPLSPILSSSYDSSVISPLSPKLYSVPVSPPISEHRYVIPVNSVISRRPSLDITTVGIIFCNSNKILLVNNEFGQWTIPSGNKNIDESNKSAALRIFKTMTGSDINEHLIINVNKKIRIHRNGKMSVIYTIISGQNIPLMSSNVISIPLDSLKNLVMFNRPYGEVKNIIDFNRTLFTDINFLSN